MKKRIGILIIGMLMITSFIGVFPSEQVRAEGTIFYVGGNGPGNYTTIQAAVNASHDGDTVFVYPGTYYEHVCITHQINLLGADKTITVIDGGSSGSSVQVPDNVNHVTISGFTM